MATGNMFATLSSPESAVTNYCYTDRSTWLALEQRIPEICTWAAKEEIGILNNDELHTMAIVAFHLIWNLQDYAPAHKMLNYLEQSAYACPELLYYFKGKLLFFQNKYADALNAFSHANIITVREAKRIELATMLTAIGSYNKTDPDDIELDLFKAIVANDTANVLLKLNRIEEAILLFNFALNIQKMAYGTTQHANVVYTLRCLANAYALQGDVEIAKTICEQALALCNSVYDDANHPEVIATHTVLQTIKRSSTFTSMSAFL